MFKPALRDIPHITDDIAQIRAPQQCVVLSQNAGNVDVSDNAILTPQIVRMSAGSAICILNDNDVSLTLDGDDFPLNAIESNRLYNLLIIGDNRGCTFTWSNVTVISDQSVTVPSNKVIQKQEYLKFKLVYMTATSSLYLLLDQKYTST